MTGCGLYLPTQSQASYRSASSGPSARRPSSCFDHANEEANVRANVDDAARHADVHASAMMTDDDNDNHANDGEFPVTLGEILGATFMASPVLGLDLGIADSNDDFDRTPLLSLPSPLPLPSPLLLYLLLLGSPPEIQEFSLS